MEEDVGEGIKFVCCLIVSEMSTSRSLAILKSDSTVGWASFVHHLETAAGVTPIFLRKPDIRFLLFYQHQFNPVVPFFQLCHFKNNY